MADGVGALRDERADVGRCMHQAQAILDVALVFADALSQLANAVAEFARHAREDRRLIKWGEVLTLEVLNDRNLKGDLIAHRLNDGRDHWESE